MIGPPPRKSGMDAAADEMLRVPLAEAAWPRSEVSAPGPGGGSKQPPEWTPGMATASVEAAPCGEPVRAAGAAAAAERGETFRKANPGAAASPVKAAARARAFGLIAPWTTLYLLCYQSQDPGSQGHH